MTVEDRRKLDELVVLLMREARRRGVVVDVDPVNQEVRLIGEGPKP